MADITKTLKDAAYVAVGFAVLSYQRAQVRRREIGAQLLTQRKELETQMTSYRKQMTRIAADLQDRMEPVLDDIERRFDPLLDEMEGRLPEQAKGLVHQARTAARDARHELLRTLTPSPNGRAPRRAAA